MKLALGNRVQNAQFSHTNRSARYLIFSYSVMPMLMLVLISHAVILSICNRIPLSTPSCCNATSPSSWLPPFKLRHVGILLYGSFSGLSLKDSDPRTL